MQPTATEKLILHMLCDIHKKLEITDSFDPDLIASAISSDDCWVLDWAYNIKDVGDTNPPHVILTGNALDMYSFLSDSFNALDAQGKATVAAAVPGTEAGVEFPGFDGNNEYRYRTAARFIVDDLDRYHSMKGVADRNSHTPMAENYARQYRVFETVRPTLVQRRMTAEEIITVLRA
jgi:uncharacterized protein YfbU (UPF0304 family)